jgi:hypothetical protein
VHGTTDFGDHPGEWLGLGCDYRDDRYLELGIA